MSNAARATREADYISLPEDDSYPMSQDEADEEYSPQSPIFRSPSTTPDNSPTPSLFETEYDAYSNYATYGADSNHDGEDFARSMSPLDMGMSAFRGVNYMEGDSREIIDLTYDTNEDSLMSDE
ncbi:hypothetical protein FIBSPDRAFT_948789 [Athelia psychrophila]|uniref:Uncharacterized protein n=1 Tax=Athelia psychrophila TaxID=1759441 RepID=A0A166QH64_9AGAM|nr:hypothetical protein FIBSPDRAFT_948789 [Fibularhizoctonia sp. CBS 109695]